MLPPMVDVCLDLLTSREDAPVEPGTLARMETNAFVDRVLNEAHAYAANRGRQVILCSARARLALTLNLKQSNFPVLLRYL